MRITTRPRIKDMLVREIQKLQSTPDQAATAAEVSKVVFPANVDTSNVETNEVVTKCEPPRAAATVSKTAPQRYFKEITTYGKPVLCPLII